MRSVWKGHIRFSLVTIPIQVFSAVETKSNISFKQLHAEDNGPVGYKKICKQCQTTLSKKDIIKGYEYEPDQFAVFSSDELDQIKLKSTKAIDIEAFVNIDEVHPSRYEAVYYLGPNGEVSQKSFSLFRETLEQSGKAGIGRIIIRDREDVVLLAPYKNAIIMYKLRYPEELRSINKVPDTVDAKNDEVQLNLALTLVASMTKEFSEVDFNDRYKEALMELVQQKIAGKKIIRLEEDDDDKPVVDIMSALKASIEAAKKNKAS